MFEIKENASYRLIRHDKSRPVKNGRKNFKFLVNKILHLMPLHPESINDMVVHNVFRKLAQRVRLHDPKSNLQLRLGFEGCSRVSRFDILKLQRQMPLVNKSQQKLTLSFSGSSDIHEALVKGVSLNYVKKLASIKKFRFYFYGGGITDDGIKILSQNIGRNTKALQTAAFSFYCCHKITDSGIKHLIKNLSLQKASLKRLDLDFSRCANLTAVTIKYLASKLKSDLKNLKELDLTIYGALDKEAFLALATSFVEMKSLQKLKLNVSYFEEIDQDSLEKLCQALESNVKQYQELVLNFTGCKNISFQNKALLKPRLASVPRFLLI